MLQSFLDLVWITGHGVALGAGVLALICLVMVFFSLDTAKNWWGAFAFTFLLAVLGVEGYTVFSEKEDNAASKDSVSKIKTANDDAAKVGTELANAKNVLVEKETAITSLAKEKDSALADLVKAKDDIVKAKETVVIDLTKGKDSALAELAKAKDGIIAAKVLALADKDKVIADLLKEKTKSDLALEASQTQLAELKKAVALVLPPKTPAVISDFDPKGWKADDYWRLEKNAITLLKIPVGYQAHIQSGTGKSNTWSRLPMAGKYAFIERLEWTSNPDTVLVYFSKSGSIGNPSPEDAEIRELKMK